MSDQTEVKDKSRAEVQSRLNYGLGLPRFCTIKDMNFTGEIMHGELKSSDDYGDYYIMDDGDCYQQETLAKHYSAIFLDNDPRVPTLK